jgi:predicted ATPase
LAVEIARELALSFADGAYFVPLAAVTGRRDTCAGIAETLGVEGADTDALGSHLAPRQVLLVLDNLEQVQGAGEVVAALLAAAGELVIVATSRRPLHVSGEQEYGVPPLTLPAAGTVDDVVASPAAQLFIRHATRVRPDFQLSSENAADVAAIVTRLDGLPLAIEIAAARSKLLTPHAMVSRLGTALDLSVSDGSRPERHRTLRGTVDWSYRLLDPDQQTVFARLGVFADGGDLAALADVCPAELVNGRDLFDLVFEVVDASLADVTDTFEGEPRVTLLELVRDFARGRLAADGQLSDALDRHAQHYADLAEAMRNAIDAGRDSIRAASAVVTEYANIRAALEWLLVASVRVGGATQDDAARRSLAGLRLAAAIGGEWIYEGRHAEAEHWLEVAIERAGPIDSRDMATCLATLSNCRRFRGRDPDLIMDAARASLAVIGRSAEADSVRPYALRTLAAAQWEIDDLDAAEETYREQLDVAKAQGNAMQFHVGLAETGMLESARGNHERALELYLEAVRLADEAGNVDQVVSYQASACNAYRRLGRLDEADETLSDLVAPMLAFNDGVDLVWFAEEYAAVSAERGRVRIAARLFAAAETARAEAGMPRNSFEVEDLAGAIDLTQEALGPSEWEAVHTAARPDDIRDVLNETLDDEKP